MATKTWTGTVSTSWTTAGNWNPAAVPTSSDSVVIGSSANAPAVVGSQSITVNSLSLTSNTLSLQSFGDFFTATNGIAVAGGTLVGEGVITGAVTVTGASTIGVQNFDGQNTPELQFQNAITDSGGALTLSIADSQDELILTKDSSAHAVNFNGTGGELEILTSALMMSGQMAVAAGQVFIAGPGSTLTDANGITLSTGTIFGAGQVNAGITASGAAVLQANEGTLELSGPITDTGGALALALYATGDRLLLDAAGQSLAAQSANLDNVQGTLELNGVSLTVGSQMAIGSSTVKLDTSGSTLTDLSGVTIGNGTITGVGQVAAGITASGGSGVVTSVIASGGELFLAGNTSDTGGSKLTLSDQTSSDTLGIKAGATADTVNLNGGGLEIINGGTLTDNSALAIGAGLVQLDGPTALLVDLAGNPNITLTTGTISGAGKVNGVISASGAAHITASGGTLEIENQLTDENNALALTIASSGSTLQLDFIGAAHSVSFNGASGTLALTGQGTFTDATQLSVGTGTISLGSSLYTLTDALGIALGGGSVQGFGVVDAALTGSGTVLASGGTLELKTAIGGSAGPTFQIANGASNVLQVDSTVGAGNTFAFLGTAGALALVTDSGFNDTISGLNVGAGAKTNYVDIEGHTVTIGSVTGQGTTSGTITLSDGAKLNLTNLNSTTWSAAAVSDGAGGTDVYVQTPPTKTWTGTVSTSWTTAGNWNPAAVPTSSDSVVIGSSANAPAVVGSQSITVNSLSLTSNTLSLQSFGDFFTATNGIAVAGGTLVGEGVITGAVTVTGASTIGVQNFDGQNTPELQFQNAITDSGGALTLSIADSQDELILTKDSSAHAVNFNGTGGELEILTSALMMSGQMAVAAGQVFIAGPGSTLTDANGITLSTGTIFGAGQVNAGITASGAAVLQANEGTLELSGPITDTGGALALALYATGDRLLLDAAGQSLAAQSANLDNVQGTLELNGVSLTVGSQMAIGSSTVKLDTSGSTLTDLSGVTIGNGTITGVGQVAAGITASGGSGVVTSVIASGGELFLAGNTSDTGGSKLTLSDQTSSDTLGIKAGATADTVNLNGGGLEIINGGTLTDNSALAIGAGLVQLDGPTALLVDLAGNPNITLTTGTISGAGKVNGVISASGAAHITASGGTLEIENQLTDENNALALTIASSGSTLQLDFIGAAHSVSFNGASGTLALTGQGTFTDATQLSVGTGTISLGSSLYTLTDALGIALGGGSVQGFGVVDAALTGSGTVLASGGTLELKTAIGGSAGPTFQIANGASNVLQVDSTVGAGNTFAFLGTAGALALVTDSGFNDTISGLNVGAGAKTNYVDIEGHTVTIGSVTGQGTTSGTITLSDGAKLNLTNLNSTTWSAAAVSDGAGGTDVYVLGNSVPLNFYNNGASTVPVQNINGQMYLFQASGTNGNVGNYGASWSFVGADTFYTDGNTDIVLQDTSGQMYLLDMQGNTVEGSGNVGNYGSDWAVAGTGGFFSDGDQGIALQNTDGQIYLLDMQGNTVESGDNIGNYGSEWHVAATGDFYGDGNDDLVLQNTDGDIYLLDVHDTVAGAGNVGDFGADWKVAGAGKFLGDGNTDLVLQDTDGQIGLLDVQGSTVVGFTDVGNFGTDWQVKEVGDFFGSGHEGIALQNTNGQIYLMELNGGSISQSANLGNYGADWHIPLLPG